MASAEGIAVALLAAGQSARFGEADKLAAELGGKPLIQWAADAGRSVPAIRHFLVRGADSSFAADGYETLVNHHAGQGMSTSLRIAVHAAAQAGAAGLMILLADMPFLSAGHLHAIAAAFRVAPSEAIFSIAGDGPPQPPALLPASRFSALLRLEGDRGGRGLARGARLILAPAEQLLDIDTPDDLARARAWLVAI